MKTSAKVLTSVVAGTLAGVVANLLGKKKNSSQKKRTKELKSAANQEKSKSVYDDLHFFI